MSLAVEVTDLVKTYGKARVLDGIDLEIPSGTVMGLLGPNGAGKTTTVRIVTTLLKPTSGNVRVAGVDVVHHPARVRTRIGLANQLRDQLDCFWPGAAKVFCSVDTGIALTFLKRYPSPADARGLGEQRHAAFLKRHGYTGRKPASGAA